MVLMALCVGSGFAAIPTSATAETRSLKIYNVHTGERDVIAYKRNGRYISSGLKKLNYILRDWRENEVIKMDPRELDLLWEVYQASGSKDYVNIICGYRTNKTNSMLRGRSRASGVAKKSQHTLGKAIDFFIPDVKLSKLREIGMKFQVGGVGYYPRSGSPFVHMDTGRVRAWPRMSHKQLVKLFPNGHTLHLPPSGKRLPGYKQAQADYERRVTANSMQVAGGGASSGGNKGNGNLLAALFGSRDKGDDDAGPGSGSPRAQTQQTQVASAAVSPRQAASTNTPAPSRASNVLPGVSDVPLPAERSVALAALTPPKAVPVQPSTPAAETSKPTLTASAKTTDEAAQEDQVAQETESFPDLLAYAIPVPHLLDDRRSDTGGGETASDATAALIAKADSIEAQPVDSNVSASADPDSSPAAPVPGIRPTLTAYAEPEAAASEQIALASIPTPALSDRQDVSKAATSSAAPSVSKADVEKAPLKPALNAQSIATAARKNLPSKKVVIAALQQKAARPAAAASRSRSDPDSFAEVSGESVKGGRRGRSDLTEDMIAEWALARDDAPSTTDGEAAPRMNRPVAWSNPSGGRDEGMEEASVDPRRFASVSVYFPNN